MLRLEYHNRGREEITVREVEPVRLLEDGGRTYLQAWCRQAGAPRNFRTDRILGATASGETFEPGARHAGVGEALYTAADTRRRGGAGLLRAPGPARRRLRAHPHGHAGRGGTAAEVRIAAPDHLPGLVARHGGEVAVLEPAGHAGRRGRMAGIRAGRLRGGGTVMPWWFWILLWMFLAAAAALFVVLCGIRLFRGFMRLADDAGRGRGPPAPRPRTARRHARRRTRRRDPVGNRRALFRDPSEARLEYATPARRSRREARRRRRIARKRRARAAATVAGPLPAVT